MSHSNMARKSSKVQEKLRLPKWSWEDALKSSSKVVNVKALKHSPLSFYWSQAFFVGMVVEIENDCFPEFDNLNKEYRITEKGFWYAQVIQWAGYFGKLRLLGYPEVEVHKYDFWVHLKNMKRINFFTSITKPIPPIPHSYELQEIIKMLFASIVGKPTVNIMTDYWVENSLHHRWSVGNKVEVLDKDCVSQMRSGYIGKIQGRRIKVQYWNSYDKKESYWVHADSPQLRPPGWSANVGATISAPGTYTDKPVSSAVVTEEDPNVLILEGMVFEMINPVNVNQIAVGKVTRVLNNGFFKCRIESPVSEDDLKACTNGINEFHYHLSSEYIFPVGTWSKYGLKREFQVYEKEEKKLPLPEKSCSDIPFRVGSFMEAVDGYVTELVCPAKVVQVLGPYAVKIRFIGYTKDYDQWKPSTSLDVFPVGWCELVDYHLAPAGNEEEELEEQEEEISVEVPIDIDTSSFTKSPDLDEGMSNSSATMSNSIDSNKLKSRRKMAKPRKVIMEIDPPTMPPKEMKSGSKRGKKKQRVDADDTQHKQRRSKSRSNASVKSSDSDSITCLEDTSSDSAFGGTKPQPSLFCSTPSDTSSSKSGARRSSRNRTVPTFFGENVQRRNLNRVHLE